MKTLKFIKPIVVISLITVIYFVFSCKKDTSSTIIINGRIYDPNQKTYVANADVQFLSSKVSSGTFNPSYVTVASATTDANGNFHIEYTKDKDAAFQIAVTKDKYYDQSYDISVTSMPGGTYSPTYNIYSEAYFKIHAKNIFPYDINDHLGFVYLSTLPACFTCCNSLPKKGQGFFFRHLS